MKKEYLKNKVRNIIKKSNENWFSFLSGVFANIPVTLFLMFEAIQKSVVGWIYFGVFLCAIAISFILLYFVFRFTIKVIEIKENARLDYERYLRAIGLEGSEDPELYEDPNMRELILEEKCNEHLDKMTSIVRRILLFVFILVVIIIALWVLKNFT